MSWAAPYSASCKDQQAKCAQQLSTSSIPVTRQSEAQALSRSSSLRNGRGRSLMKDRAVQRSCSSVVAHSDMQSRKQSRTAATSLTPGRCNASHQNLLEAMHALCTCRPPQSHACAECILHDLPLHNVPFVQAAMGHLKIESVQGRLQTSFAEHEHATHWCNRGGRQIHQRTLQAS